MAELNKSKTEKVQVPEVRDFQYGLGYIMAKLAGLCVQASKPVDIRNQNAVDSRDKISGKIARLQNLKDSRMNK